MLAELFARLSGRQTAPDRRHDVGVAMAALLVRCARTDGTYAAAEAHLIDDVLAARFGLLSARARMLRSEGEVLEAEAGDTVHLTRAIKDHVPYEDRAGVVEALWRVVLADADRDAHENAYLRLVANLLGVTDVDSALARQRAGKA
jgi:uncharacterized tellurite resistance protein B-like protein